MDQMNMSTISVEIDRVPHCVVFPPRKVHKGTVFFLHGLGDSARNISQHLKGYWDSPLLDNIKLVMPTASFMPVTGNRGRYMPSWFDCYSFDTVNRKEDEQGLYLASAWLNELIQVEQDINGIPASRIIIGGISQGSAVSLLTALTTLHPIGGVFVLSSYIPLRKKIHEIFSPNVKNLSIFWGHGAADTQVPHDSWKSLAEALADKIGIPFVFSDDNGNRLEKKDLETTGFNVLRFHSYNALGHWFNEDEFRDLTTWISFIMEK